MGERSIYIRDLVEKVRILNKRLDVVHDMLLNIPNMTAEQRAKRKQMLEVIARRGDEPRRPPWSCDG